MNNVDATNNSVEALAALYMEQAYCDGTRTSYYDSGNTYEEHHQNGTYHINNPGTGWLETHNNSYFNK